MIQAKPTRRLAGLPRVYEQLRGFEQGLGDQKGEKSPGRPSQKLRFLSGRKAANYGTHYFVVAGEKPAREVVLESAVDPETARNMHAEHRT